MGQTNTERVCNYARAPGPVQLRAGGATYIGTRSPLVEIILLASCLFPVLLPFAELLVSYSECRQS